jgi:hypothetical protein
MASAICCDNCGKFATLPASVSYYANFMPLPRGWRAIAVRTGNSENDRHPYFDACSPECAGTLAAKAVTPPKRKRQAVKT